MGFLMFHFLAARLVNLRTHAVHPRDDHCPPVFYATPSNAVRPHTTANRAHLGHLHAGRGGQRRRHGALDWQSNEDVVHRRTITLFGEGVC